jgi:glutamate transport system permease protein
VSEAVLYDAAGPRGRRRILVGSVVGVLLVAAVLGAAVARVAAKGGFDAELWRVLTQGAVQRLILRGLAATLQAALVAMVLSILVGAVLAIGRLSRRAWLARAAGAWVELFRGLPLLLLILFLFLGLPAVGITISVFWALVAGLTLYNSAVIGEIFRAGILSLPKGQTEAAYAIGLRRGQTLRLILIPQAVRRMLPALISQLVTLLKDTSLGFVIGYAELLRNGRGAVEFLGGRYSIPIYTAIAVVYIAVNASLSLLARWLDRRTRRRLGRTVQPSAADEAA